LWAGRDCHDDAEDDASGELQVTQTLREDMIEGFTQADVLRLARVLRALAAAGLIDEWHVFLQTIDGQTAETPVVAMTYEPTQGDRVRSRGPQAP
jgi:hypothetical protein